MEHANKGLMLFLLMRHTGVPAARAALVLASMLTRLCPRFGRVLC